MVNKQENGFRDGKSKEDFLTTLTDEELHRIENIREAKERESVNEYAFKLLVLADQNRSAFDLLKIDIEDNVISVLTHYQEILDNKVCFDTDMPKKNSKGQEMSKEDIKINIMMREKMIRQHMIVIRNDLSRLYTYIGAKSLDLKEFFNEKQFNEVVEDVIKKLDKTPYSLL